MNDVEKLRVLIPHWIEHNEEHADEFRRWAERVEDASADIAAAAESMKHTNQILVMALEKLGGPLSIEHIHE
jgi:hypothetical protein